MSAATATKPTQFTDYAHRADPYPLYAALREAGPVVRQDDGSYLVTTYYDIRTLANDPRLSADPRSLTPGTGGALAQEEESNLRRSFIRLDPPEHARLRDVAMEPFGPPHSPRFIHDMRTDLTRIITGLLDAFEGKDQVDIVDEFAYQLPVAAICKILGVPHEDEGRFHVWVEKVVDSLDAGPGEDGAQRAREGDSARQELAVYLAELIEDKKRHPGEGMLGTLAPQTGPGGRMSPAELVSTAALLLLAGHETTVNLISNATLTLLRHPDVLQRFRAEPGLAVPLVEEVLRYEPPVQFLPFFAALDDIDVADTVIPKGSPVSLLLASGNRDPRRFEDPDRFVPDRTDNQHLSFYTGIHYCFGAALARLEAQIALTELFRRVDGPRLVEDPPPYRQSPVLRGPRHLPLALRGVTP
ncbi:cytochrome P450 [Streptomyces sp. NPDC006393]|uniref:cytochrome P450 n=1 Tax=Streptomyces sp. NPDC006393 TaxID=3156763 RepID=UPI0033F88246